MPSPESLPPQPNKEGEILVFIIMLIGILIPVIGGSVALAYFLNKLDFILRRKKK